MKPLVFEVPIKTKSVNASFRGDWRARSGAAKYQRAKVSKLMPAWEGGPLLEVRLTRVSRGVMDDDAVATALKHVRDAVAAKLGLDDGSPLIRWTYAQAKGEACVRVEVESMGGGMPAIAQAFREHEAEVERIVAPPPPMDWLPPEWKALREAVIKKAPKDETTAERLKRLAVPNTRGVKP